MEALAPAHDNRIYQKYDQKSLKNKQKNKVSFCRDFELNYDKSTALLCVSYPLTEENNIELLKEAIKGLLEQNILIALSGIGSEKYQAFFTHLAETHPSQMVILSENEENKRKMYAASDIFINTSTQKDCLLEMVKAMAYGVVPVSLPHKKLTDYNGVKEEGNAFIYKKESSWSLFSGVIRALENFKFPYDWKAIQVSAMES